MPQWHLPLDPECPRNPLQGFWEDPMTAQSGCGDEVLAYLERRHLRDCQRCQEYGVANIEVEA